MFIAQTPGQSRPWSIACGTALILAASPAVAQAQSAPSEPITTYQAASFASAAPTNAGDMLARVPGFSIVEANADVRGYDGAQGNVLIDGARPTSKRESLSDLLARIPADSVDRIELIRGGVAGVEMAGHAVVANIVRRRDTSVEAALQTGGVLATDGWAAPQGQAEYARRWGDRSLELAVSLSPELDDDSGLGTIVRLSPQGRETDRRALDTRTVKTKADSSATWRQPLAGGDLTATGALRGEQARTDTDIVGISPFRGHERVDEDEDFLETEVGARYVRPFGAADRLELVASQQLGWLNEVERGRDDDDAELFQQNTDTGESIARIDLTHVRSDHLTLTLGLEGAFNFLESQARLEENGAVQSLPGSDVQIEERRGEGSVGATWAPADAWLIKGDIRIERSAISQMGDTPLERTFTYVKPRLSLRWDATSDDQLRLSISREVGQLAFADFVATASLETDQVTAGNATLEPDKTWRLVAAWERRLWSDASATLTFTHDEISDVVDRVLVTNSTDVFDAPGNIGDGRRDVVQLDVSAPLDRFGFSRGRLKTSLQWHESEVVDPITGEVRRISQEKPFVGDILVTQDLPALSMNWGVQIEHISEHKTRYRFDEVSRQAEAIGWTAFVERRFGGHWQARLEATDLFGRDFTTRRERYDGPRSTRPLDKIEQRDRVTPGFVSLTFRRTLG
ncbi:TonB-dependent receptor plug domain-containing protein [Brevundimonas sp.]|uniref:TonB-dependent receptor plug domain-containing protein n=1 Tax=Brevundimonas sp. TaxID=1871086 RepID=UPI003D0DEA6B